MSCLLLTLLLTLTAHSIEKAPEPVVRGKPLSYWLELLNSPVADNRIQATFAVGSVGDAPAIERLIAITEDADYDVRYSAAVALGRLGTAAAPAVPALIRMFRDTANDRPLICPGCGADGTALVQIGKPAVPDLLVAAGDPDWRVRVQAVGCLARFPAEAERVVPSLAASVNDPHLAVRLVAIQGLGKLGPKAKSALSVVQAAAADADTGVRAEARIALRKISGE